MPERMMVTVSAAGVNSNEWRIMGRIFRN